MDKLTIANLTAALETATSPAILWSGGKDSTLLLMAARQLGYNLPAVWFRDGAYNDDIMQRVHELNLTLYSWAPANMYLLAHDGSVALISEFSINGELLPMLTDVVGKKGGRCLAVETARTPQLYMPFDLLLSGYKDCDNHWAAGNKLLYPEGLMLGQTRLTAPIRHLTDEQVLDELAAMNISFHQRDDRMPICSDCVAGKPLHWDKPLDLTAFRSRVKL